MNYNFAHESRMSNLVLSRLSISLFGSFEVRLDGRLLDAFEYDKVRALLAYLAMEAGRAQQRAFLCALLWPGLPEHAARQNLSQALTHLRKALGDRQSEHPFLVATTDEVGLNPQASWDVDAIRLSRLLAEAEAHVHCGWHVCSPCAEKLRQAVALYRGDFLAHFSLGDSAAFEEWAVVWREQLRQRMLSALERLIEYTEWRGAYSQAIEAARRHVQLEPLQDAPQRELMRLLALSGQRSAALAQYAYWQRLLDEEMGLAPEPETQALYQRILTGAGGQALRRFQAPPGYLPLPPAPLIGRSTDVETVCAWLLDGSPPARMVTLIGAPGIGKTRLALEIAERLSFDFEDGAYFVELAPLASATQLPAAVAQVLGIVERADQLLAATLTDALRSRHVLLVLDNFEHLLEGASLVATLLSACPALKVLVTSRSPLQLRSERQYLLSTLSEADAVELFAGRARTVQPAFALTAQNREAVAALCAQVDRLPLAIELVAARAGLFSLEGLSQQLGSQRETSENTWRDLPGRHRTLESAIAWSYDRLPPATQHAFACFGVFVNGGTLEAVRAVLDDGDFSPGILAQLVHAGLLHRQDSAGEERFWALQTLREFALARLALLGCADLARQRHAEYFCDFAERAYEGLLGPDQIRWGARVAADFDNLRTALYWASGQGLIAMALCIATGIFRYCWQRGLMREALAWFEPLFAQRHLAAPDVQSRAFRAAGILSWGLSDYTRAQAYLQAATETAQLAGDEYLLAAAMTNLGLLFKEQGAWEKAGDYLAQAIAQNLAIKDKPHAVKFPQVILAGLWVRMGRWDEARQLYEESLSHNRQLGDLEGMANSLYGLALVANAYGEYALAQRRGAEALDLYTALNHQCGVAWVHECLGNVLRDSGEAVAAHHHYVQALRIWHERGDVASMGALLENVTCLLAKQHHWRVCVRLLSAAEHLRRQAGVALTPYEIGQHEQTLAAGRAALGRAVFQKCWLEGADFTPDDVVSAYPGEIE